MSEEQGGARNGTEPAIHVRDRRRFDANGDPIDPSERDAPEAQEAASPGPSELPPAPDPRDEQLAQQAVRIDELTRA